jgi:ABC-type transport system involved in multi-copper enzyme maturation permease subunit
VRALAAVVPFVVVISLLYMWRISLIVDPNYQPYELWRGGLMTSVALMVTVALVLSPALLAGSLAGDRERGVLGLLLTTRVSPREIVTGRFAGKLSQMAMIMLAGLPLLAFNASLAGFGAGSIAIGVAMPLAVAFGAGGLALAASVISKRGIAALVTVYLLLVGLLLTPMLQGVGLPAWLEQGVLPFNPYAGVSPLAWDENRSPGMGVVALWTALGFVGLALAAWRLRPISFAREAGARKRFSLLPRRRPPVSETHPMLWKALHVEDVGALGWFGRLLGALVLAWLAGCSTVLMVIAAWSLWITPDSHWESWATAALHDWVARPSILASVLIQWALGIQAAVAVSAERERGTWDALLCSPLEGREIVWGKICASLVALRWLLAAAIWAWTGALVLGAMKVADYVGVMTGVIATGVLMTAVGLRASLAARTMTRSVVMTIGVWLGAFLGLGVVTLIAMLAFLLAGLSVYISVQYLLQWLGATNALATWTNWPFWSLSWFSFDIFYPIMNAAVTLFLAALVIADLRLRFDRLAGRITGERVALKFDRAMLGPPIKTMSKGKAIPAPVHSEPARDAALEAAEEPAPRGV